MQTQCTLLEAEILKLSPEEREALLFQLLTSLTNNKEIDEAWAIETERRIADIDNNRTSVIPLNEALAHVRAILP